MDYAMVFKNMFESIPEFRKIVLLLFLVKIDVGLITECGFLKTDFICLCEKFNLTSLEQNKDYLGYKKSEKESFVEKILDK